MYNAIKKNKILRNKFKQVRDLYFEKYKILMKKMEDDTNRWEDRIRTNNFKISVEPQQKLG